MAEEREESTHPPGEPRVVYYAESPQFDDEIDLGALASALWAEKWLVSGITVFAALVGVAVAYWLPNTYRAEALLASASEEQQSMLGGLTQQFGGLAGLAGLNVPQGETDQLTIAIETLKSRSFLTDFVRRRKLEVPLMAATGWNDESKEWKIDDNIYDSASASWVGNVANRDSPEPTDWEVYEAMSDRLTVNRDATTGLVTVALKLYSPLAAKQWVDWLIADVNARMRNEEIAEAEKSIGYLRKQAEGTALAEMRNVFFTLIEQQTQRRMLAEVRDEFAFKTIDPAVVPEEKTFPPRALIALGAAMFGGFLGIVIVLIRNNLRKGGESAVD